VSNQAGAADEAGSRWQDKAAMMVPLLVFFVLGTLIDTSPLRDGESINSTAYFWSVSLRVIGMAVAVLIFLRSITRQFPLKIDRWGWLTGVLGVVLWIGICSLQLERSLIEMIGLSAERWLPGREGVDPFSTYSGGSALLSFLAFRFALLAVCLPVAEELFLRGFLMRAVEAENWTEIPISAVGPTGLILGTVYGVATHPSEAFAALVWFSLVSLLMVKTQRFWNCVVAHAVTNLLLGLYVCVFAQWQLW
jgi:CAAX prenyl protease-like protein